MSDSEDSDLEEGVSDMRHKTKMMCSSQFPFINMEPPDVIFERWTRMDAHMKRRLGQMMHVSVFWWHIILRQQESHSTTLWAMDMGFLDSNVSNDLNLKRLEKIEILESILSAMERGLSQRDMEVKARAVVSLGRLFIVHEDCLAEAIAWLLDSGEPELRQKLLDLGSVEIRYRTLQVIFYEYSRFIQVVAYSKQKAIEELRTEPDQWALSKSEEMKNKGNEYFQRKKYDVALKWYSKAIKHHPTNHILYGNRALCLLRTGKYLKALGDGKRAMILEPMWAKGHYRFCDALFLLGEHQKALLFNRRAQDACASDQEGHKDLLQQLERFQTELQDSKGDAKDKKTDPKKIHVKVGSQAADVTAGPLKSSQLPEAQPPSSEDPKPEDLKNQEVTSGIACVHHEGKPDRFKDMKSDMSPRKPKKSTPVERTTPRTKLKAPEKENTSLVVVGEPAIRSFSAAMLEAYTALNDQRCHNAQQSFAEALQIMESSNPTELSLTELDKSVLLYGYATALLETGQPEELAQAEKLLTRLESSERKFQCLVHYGLGRVYLKENMFAKALERFSNALLMIQRNITPGKLTWPTSRTILQETQPAWLKEQLENLEQLCKFPPNPDAVCQHQHCLAHSVRIYFSDPDFKGFIQLWCCQSCRLEYHMNCWKKLKALSFNDKNDKEFLKDCCLTPDCSGRIRHIIIFDSTGLVKCEFKATIPKIRAADRPRFKQQCSSIKKLKCKSDRKLRRKQQRLAARLSQQEKKEMISSDDFKEQIPLKGRASPRLTVYMDCVLNQLHQNRAMFEEEEVSEINMSCFLDALQPWLGLCVPECVLGEPGGMKLLVEVLLESRSRVCVRVFIQTLADKGDAQPRLQRWAQKINNAGLIAAEGFLSRHAALLSSLNFIHLLTFTPLLECLRDHLKSFSALSDSKNQALKVMEHLQQAPAKDKRLFIWSLEAHRQFYDSIHIALDQYFEDDAVCLVIKKTEDEEHLNSVFKSKNRHRKKKRELKAVVVMPAMRSHPKEEDDVELFSEEDSLSFLDDCDPFYVPERLRNQLADFEEKYSSYSHRSYYQRILDNHPDPTKESLYDYFASILEQHGPLRVSDPLMVGELDSFPPEAQDKIFEAGGLESFLLQSLRFTQAEGCIGLMKHAITLAQTAMPNNTNFSNTPVNLTAAVREPFSSSLSSAVLNPHLIKTQYNPNLIPSNLEFWSNTYPAPQNTHQIALNGGDQSHQPIPYDLHSSPVADEVKENTPEQLKAQLVESRAVKCKQNLDDRKEVSINTEPYSYFEKNHGEMMQTEKRMHWLREEIHTMRSGQNDTLQKRKEELRELEEENQAITESIQIASAELTLFQKKLEEVVKKDQEEKKENQETLKNLKMEIKDLSEQQESLSKTITLMNREYEAELERFLELGNQYAVKRSSLEEEIKSFRDTCMNAERRSTSAQVSVLQCQRERALRKLRLSVSEGKMLITHLAEISHSIPSAAMISSLDDWKRHVCELEEAISSTEVAFVSRIEEVRKGTRLSSLLEISLPRVPSAPELPVIPQAPQFNGPPPATQVQPPSERPPSATLMPPRSNTPQLRVAAAEETGVRQQSVYHRILERLSLMFPHHNRQVLGGFIQELHSSNSSLSSMSYDEVISQAVQLILDRQENAREQIKAGTAQSQAQAWKNVQDRHRNRGIALNMEDPCIICHDEMRPEELCVLECRHSFHRECIKSWLKNQSTCPTCREHALLPEDFPVLPGRARPHAHTHFS